ncbi:Protein ENL, partial [Halocaridina rubra]
MSSKNVVVTLELGHRATVRSQRTDEGFTHDWEVFVQGANGARIEAFIEKIVFTLHKSFAKPKRILKVPPYRVNEKGYGGFTMPIEITFKTNHPEDTRKTCFEYDLYLQHVDNPPINNMRKEKLTFLKPSEDFRKKLLQGGGVTDHEQSAPVKKMTSPKNNALVSMMAHEESNTNDKGGSVSRPSGGAKIKPQNAQQSHSDGSKKHKHPPVK